MRLVTKWLNTRDNHDTASWASILVVTALGLRSVSQEDVISVDASRREAIINYCMRNAQSTLPELVTRDEDLLGVQVTLALTMLFQDAIDVRPASILVGMAIRLGHRLQLQSKSARKHFSAEEAQHRSDVFWVAYILDKVT
jgi:hypothetical protein